MKAALLTRVLRRSCREWLDGAFLVSVIAATPYGCSSAPSVEVDYRESMLMPDSIAREIVSRYAGAEWAEQPYVIRSYRRRSGRVREATFVRYKELYLSDSSVSGKSGCVTVRKRGYDSGNDYEICTVSAQEGNELRKALMALGVLP